MWPALFWVLWIMLGVAAEIFFLRMGYGTLSEQFWFLRKSLGVNAYSLILFFLAAFFAWLLVHFGWQAPGGSSD